MIAIIGAGISGLSLAYFLQKNGIPYVLLEASNRSGGYIWSEKKDDYLLEYGPNSLLADDKLLELIEELGLKEEMTPAEAVNKNRFIFRNGQYQKLPAKPQALLFNSFFSWKTKLAILKELSYKGKGPENESIAAFFARHFSQELVDYAVDPFVSGIYAGNPDQLLVEKTFGRILSMEREHGSIIRGFMKQGKTTKRKVTFSFKEGIQSLPQQLAKKVDVRFNSRVTDIKKGENGFTLHTSNGAVEAENVVLALPSFKAAPIVESTYPSFAKALNNVNYPPMCAVHTAFKREDVGHPLDGFGGLNPAKEKQFAAGSIWSSSIFPHRAPQDRVLFNSFVGGARNPAHIQKTDAEIKDTLTAELTKAYNIKGKPVFQEVMRWENAIPQYDKNILPVHQELDAVKNDGLHVCANWVDGVSVSDCINKARSLAEEFKDIREKASV